MHVWLTLMGDHGHGHGSAPSDRRRLSRALAIISVVLLAEVVGAGLTGSLALLADAGHLATDVLGLAVALTATTLAQRPSSRYRTYGLGARAAGGRAAHEHTC